MRRWGRRRRSSWRDDGMVGLAGELLAEIATQDHLHSDGYPATRDGVRLGIATVEDELDEALTAWRRERRSRGWRSTRAELLQAAAVALRLIRSIDGDGSGGAGSGGRSTGGGGLSVAGSAGSAGPAHTAGAGKPALAASVGPAVGAEPFWNLTGGRRPAEPVDGLFAEICTSEGRHVHDGFYGPEECARCGAPTPGSRGGRGNPRTKPPAAPATGPSKSDH